MGAQEWQIERFVEVEGSLSPGDLKHTDRPDALVRTEAGALGIEHTRIFTPSEQV